MIALATATAYSADSFSSAGGEPAWEFSAAGYYYAFPAEDDLLIMVATADRGGLHLEARYNYEGVRTDSAFAGRNLSTGRAVGIALTPMAGGAFGSTSGPLQALGASLGHSIVDVYLEMEYSIDTRGTSTNFLYSWSELGVAPTDLVRFGLSVQRTRVKQRPLVLDRGLFAQITPPYGAVSLYAFDLFTDSWFLLVGLELAW